MLTQIYNIFSHHSFFNGFNFRHILHSILTCPHDSIQILTIKLGWLCLMTSLYVHYVPLQLQSWLLANINMLIFESLFWKVLLYTSLAYWTIRIMLACCILYLKLRIRVLNGTIILLMHICKRKWGWSYIWIIYLG